MLGCMRIESSASTGSVGKIPGSSREHSAPSGTLQSEPRRCKLPFLTVLPSVLNVSFGRAGLPEPRDFNLASPFFRHSIERPENPALVLDDEVYSYAELAFLAARIAGWLAASAPADTSKTHVGIIASRSLEAYAGILGACWAGAAYIPINPKLPVLALRQILQAAQPHAIIVDAAGWRRLEESGAMDGVPILSPGSLERPSGGPRRASVLDGICALEKPVLVPGNQTAYVIFTSGTTAAPKGVIIRADSVRHFLDYGRSVYDLNSRDRFSNFSEISFDFSVLDLWLAWDSGASLHVVPEAQLLAPAKFIRAHQLTFWASVPSVIGFLDRLKQLKEGSFPSLRISYFCGEALPVASALAWQRASPNSVVDNHYGPTESTVACSVERLSNQPRTTPGRDIIPIGRPYPGMRLAIVDEAARFLPPGEAGELALSGPQIAAGYLGAPELTLARFPQLEHPEVGSSRWYLTGDLAFEDAGGTFHHLGRVDYQVKVLGHRIELEEVDAHLREVCGCGSVAAVAWPVHHGTAGGIIAFVAGSSLGPAEIMTRLKARVAPYAMPREVISLPCLPLTHNGKTDRKALLSMLEDRGNAIGS
jgi:D-alanine--poly(phosphoribitol) ligase subunit 1